MLLQNNTLKLFLNSLTENIILTQNFPVFNLFEQKVGFPNFLCRLSFLSNYKSAQGKHTHKDYSKWSICIWNRSISIFFNPSETIRWLGFIRYGSKLRRSIWQITLSVLYNQPSDTTVNVTYINSKCLVSNIVSGRCLYNSCHNYCSTSLWAVLWQDLYPMKARHFQLVRIWSASFQIFFF